jgi:hypothetical protein
MLKPSMVSEFYLPPYTELQNENILNARYDYLVLEVEKYVKQQKSSNHNWHLIKIEKTPQSQVY